MSLPEPQIHGLQVEENLLTAARKAGNISMSLPESQIQGLQAKENLLTAAHNAGNIDMSLPEPQIRGLQVGENVLTAARKTGNIDMSLPDPRIWGLQAEQKLPTATRNASNIDMSLPEPQIRSLQARENVLTAAHKAGNIDMSLPEPQIWSLQAREKIITAARCGGIINMDQLETEVRRQGMAQRLGISVDELVARDAVRSATTFAATEDESHVDVMRREEFEQAGKILDDYPDWSAIASIVKDKPPPKEMKRVRKQVRQCIKEVINNHDYQPTKREQSHWHRRNPGTFNHYTRTGDVNVAITRRLLAIHTHKQALKIISGLSITVMMSNAGSARR